MGGQPKTPIVASIVFGINYGVRTRYQSVRSETAVPWPKLRDDVIARLPDISKTVYVYIVLNMYLYLHHQSAC